MNGQPKWRDVYVRMWSHDRAESHNAFCRRTASTEMLGIVGRALRAAGQETSAQEVSPVPPPPYRPGD